MASFSIVQRSKVRGARRLDPDYYHSEYLKLARHLEQADFKEKGVLRRYIHSAINFGAYSLCNYIVFMESGVPYLYTQDIRNNYIEFDNLHYISESVDGILYKSRVGDRHVLLTMAGVYLGRSAVFDESIKANSNQAIAKITVQEDLLNPYYLSTFLNSLYGNFQIKRNKTGTARDNINLGQIKELFIPVLSKNFQLQIEQRVKQGKQRLLDSKQFYIHAEQIFLSELGLSDWRPKHCLTYVRHHSETARAFRLDAEYFQPKFQELLGQLEKGIHLVRLGGLVNLSKGFEVGSSAYTDTGIPFWRVSNISKHGLDDSNLNFITEELYQSLQKVYEPKQGELLLTKDATPGVAYYLDVPTKGIASGGILRLSMKSLIQPYYLELCLNSMFVQLQIERDAGGSIIKHWKPSDVRKTLIPRLLSTKETDIAQLVQRSHVARYEGLALLEKTKRAVEIALELGEEIAMMFLNVR